MTCTFWFTGLPASGKTTLAGLLAHTLRTRGAKVEILDGDGLREILKTVGYSKEERRRHIMSAAFTSLLLNRNGISVIAAFVSPYQDMRDEARALLGKTFVEIYVNCPVEVCIERDPKGLYGKAARGEITGFTGVDDPYEAPVSPDLTLYTGRESVQASFEKLIGFVGSLPLT